MILEDLAGQLRRRMRSARRRLAAAQAGRGLLLTVFVGSTAWLAAVAAEGVLWLEPGARGLLFWFVVLAAVAALAGLVAWPLLRWGGWARPIADDEVADRIGRRFPEVGDRLLNLTQLLDGRHSDSPAPLVTGAAERLGKALAGVPFDRVEDFSVARRTARWLLVPALGLVLFVVAAPTTFRSASVRLLRNGIDFSRPAPFSLVVDPGDVSLVKGADLRVLARFSGPVVPTGSSLETRLEGESVVESVSLPVQDAFSEHTLVNLRRTLSYRVVAGEVSSDWYTAEVIDRPVTGRLQVVLRFPPYTRRPPEPLQPDEGDMAALRGTEALVRSVVSGPAVGAAFIGFGSGSMVPMAIEGRAILGSFRVLRDDTWGLSVESVDGVAGEDQVRYRIRALDDAAPVIELLSPVADMDLDETTEVPLAWRLSDDFGFSGLRLAFRLAESRFGSAPDSVFSTGLEIGDPHAAEQTGEHLWNVARDTDLDPVPGDVIVFWLEVTDNDEVTGPKATRTPEIRLRMPSLADRYEELDERQDETEDALEELAQDADALRRRFEELQEALRSRPESDWQDERTVERLQERQAGMERSVEDIAERIESMTDSMERNDLVSEETLELFRDLREVAEEISSPELDDALRRLQEAMQQMDLGRMQEAMEDFRFSEEQYRQRLERTLELFRNLRLQKDLDEASRRAEDLARTEENLAEETGQVDEEPDSGEDESAKVDRLAQEQERAAGEMESLERKLDEITERMDDVRSAPKQPMRTLTDDVRSKHMPDQMRRNAGEMRDGAMQPAQQGQQRMAEELRGVQQRLGQLSQGMQGQQASVNLAGLRRALDDVLALSEDQEALRAGIQELAADSPALREAAQRQMRLSEGLAIVSDSLQALSRSIPQMTRAVQAHAGESLREMAEATSAMSERVAPRAAGHQKGSMTHLNELALLLVDLMDRMQNGQGGGGAMSMQQLMEQLSELAGQQQQLNAQIQQLLNDMAGSRLSQDMESRMRDLSARQQRIREQLQDLARNRTLKDSALGDLERVAEQMQETIDELSRSRLSGRTTQRQQQILTRLLEATRSLQERGRERRRQSRTAEDPRERERPGALTPDERRERLRRDLIRALEGGYAPEYQELIRRYFELLQQRPGG